MFKAVFLLSVLAVVLVVCCNGQQQQQPGAPPNIVFLLADDQDLLLGGMDPMKFTRSFMAEGGTTLTNFFVNTPVCCPSRTTLLTGRYPHNWHTTRGGCMHMNVSNNAFEQSTVGIQMQALKYRTGMFGKLLNPGGMKLYCDKHNRVPLPGFDEFLAMCNDNRYFGNELVHKGGLITTGNDPQDYLTSVIGNASLKFVEQAVDDKMPFFVYIAPHAPHVPATPAPWYADQFSGLKAPRTPNYNYSALDHHYVIRQQQPLSTKEGQESDTLFENRWKTLLSVDDILKDLVDLLKTKGELDRTFFIYTSDHGFQLGQFRLPSCKLQPYEHDIRVPFYIRGPGVSANASVGAVVGMVDVAPTIVALGGGDDSSAMDGRSFAGQLAQPDASSWRDKHMIEYWSLGDVIRYGHYIDLPNNTYIAARLVNNTHNYLYAEFYKDKNEVSFASPFEFELFDIAKDPYQMTNLYGTDKADKNLVQELHDFLHMQIKCKGQDCV